MSTDPLLKAVALGDARCPDGEALVRLGALVRGVAPVSGDLGPAITARLSGLDEESLPPALARTIAGIQPRPVDLTARILAGLHAAPPVTDQRRLRIWTWVVAGHVAALLLLTVLATGVVREREAAPEATGGWAAAVALPVPVATSLPRDWTVLPASGHDLVGARREARDRQALRRQFGTERSAGAVSCGLAWLATQDIPTGTTDADLATRSVVALAMLGEGDAVTAARWLADMPRPQGATSQALLALALVDVALLTREPADAVRAEAALRDLPVSGPGPGSLGGAAFLAVESARAGGLTVAERQVAAVRTDLGRPLPGADADTGRLGLAVVARLWLGYRDNPSTALLVERLAAVTPQAPVDPLAWWLPTLALRDAGGPAWDQWNADLQATLLPVFEDVAPGRARLPAAVVRHAPDDRFATALGILCLQAAYRTVPLRP